MALTTLYNSTNHPLTWDKVNETLKAVDDNFTFVSSQVTTGVLQDLSQDITPNIVGTFDLGTPTQRWDNIYANSLSVNNSIVANVTGDLKGSVFGDDSTPIVDATNNVLNGNLTGNVTGNITGNLTGNVKDELGGTVLVAASGGASNYIGNVTGDVTGDLSGNATTVTNGVYTVGDQTIAGIKTFSSTIKGNVQGNLTGNVLGNVIGDVVGSVYSDDSSGVLVDGLEGVLNTYKLDRVGAQDGDSLVWSSSNSRWEPGAGSGGGGVGLTSRVTRAGSTSSIADGVIGNTTIQGAFSGYMVLKLQVDAAAWVRVYTDNASRTADASRLESDDPAPGAGVVVETITTGADTILISPAVLGFNNESPVTTDIPIAVKNKSGGTRTFTVTLTLIQLEA